MKLREIKGECPNCGSQKCTMVANPETGEDSRFCPYCGFYDGEKHYSSVPKPYGAYCIKDGKEGLIRGTLETEEDYIKFCGEVVSLSNQTNDIIYAKVNRFVDNVHTEEFIIGGVGVGDSVVLTVNALANLGLEELEYEVIDMLEGHEDMPLVIANERYGKDWVQFVSRDEVIQLTN